MTPEDLGSLKRRVKEEIRQRMRSLRRVLPADARNFRSEAACRRVIAMPHFQAATTVMGYLAVRNELDPALILEEARRLGKIVALPRVDGAALALHRSDSGDALIESPLGIPEPGPEAPGIEDADVDLVLVPALGVDPTGHRIGYGHGYYDRLLPRLKNATRIALAYDFQLLAEAVNDEQDEAAHQVVTDARVIAVESD